jgi:hypothetical protein
VLLQYNEDTLTLVDVTDKANMIEISRTGYTGAEQSVIYVIITFPSSNFIQAPTTPTRAG